MFTSECEIIVCTILSIIWYQTKHDNVKKLCVIGAVISILILFVRQKNNVLKLHRINTDGINEVLILETNLNNIYSLFLLDTGYAGPPVLSRSYLAVNKNKYFSNIAHTYNYLLQNMSTVTEDDEHKAINNYINKSGCLPFTSGCTMRLMGIGSVQEQQADMLMCPMLKIKNELGIMSSPKKATQTYADVFVTNSLKSSIHIMTCDFLMHHSPCLIEIEHQKLQLSIPTANYLLMYQHFDRYPAKFSGGSFMIEIKINDIGFKLTVDTGSPGPIAIGSNASKKIKKCVAHKRKTLKQKGVNGEVVCSDIVEVDVEFGKKTYKAPIFINNLPTDFVDGYVGLGFLRGFDILISGQEIGFRRNNLHFHTFEHYENIAEDGTCNTDLECLKS
tara:strand:- start:285 stop:1451 length:1167 start_codon:yes stop_codon:yes gene_type:complete